MQQNNQFTLQVLLSHGWGLQLVAAGDGRGTPAVPQCQVLQQERSAAKQGSGQLLLLLGSKPRTHKNQVLYFVCLSQCFLWCKGLQAWCDARISCPGARASSPAR